MAKQKLNGNRKLSNKQVEQLRKSYASGKTTMRALATRFGVASSTVSDIVNQKTHRVAA